MGLLERLRPLSDFDPSRSRPFRVGPTTYGRIPHERAEELRRRGDPLRVEPDAVVLDPRLARFEDRTEAMAGVVADLQREGIVPSDRPEPYAVVRRFGEEPAFHLDRSAVRFFGVRCFGVHLNGYVERPEGTALWVARRARTRRNHPGKLDHLVGGGQPAGLGLVENLVKECREEADLPEALAREAVPAGSLAFAYDGPRGFHDDFVFAFDLALPADFVPRNTDGEVESFALWPTDRVLASLRSSDEWAPDVAPVVIRFLLRRGLVPADEPGLEEIERRVDAPRAVGERS